MATRRIVLVRHGQHNSQQDEDELGGSLTPLGQEQAWLTAQRLQGMPVAAIHCSSMRRTVETAALIALQFPKVPMLESEILWECIPCLPDFQSQLYKESYSKNVLEAGQHQAQQAFSRFFSPAHDENRLEIVVSHGNLIRYLVLQSLGARPNLWANLEICNCSISEVNILADGIINLVSFNDTGHLPRELKTYL